MRGYRPEDLGFLWDMLYETAFWRPDATRPPRAEALSGPAFARYLEASADRATRPWWRWTRRVERGSGPPGTVS